MEKLITNFEIKVSTPDCLPGASIWRVEIYLMENIAQVLPYLNSVLTGADYNHRGNVLLWDHGGKRYAIRPHEIAIAPVEDRHEAEMVARDITDMINDIWSRRNEITPNYEGKRPAPRIMDIYKLLPRTNCRQCGHPTCMAFAAALIGGESQPYTCPDLNSEVSDELTRILCGGK